MGDAAGIGPEIVSKVLSMQETCQYCRPIVIGDARVLNQSQRVAHTTLDVHAVKHVSEARFIREAMDVIDLSNIKTDELRMGEAQAMAGGASFEYVKKAVELALDGEIDAITTAPICKEAMRMAGVKYPGHTEILADMTGTKDFAIMFVSDTLKEILVTGHVSLRNAIDLVKKNSVLFAIRMAHESMKKFGKPHPRIAVAGLNPHAGEARMFGSEDAEEIAPAVDEAKRLGIDVVGPLPADTVFYRAISGQFDIVVAMYHDQGLIPIKLQGFDRAVNVTVGLPIIRTSPDHGTAYDIAGRGLGTANPASLLEAIKVASELSTHKTHAQ